MAPTRKSRSVNKKYSYINEVSPTKDGENAKRNNSRKRKLADMLGPQWSKEELTRFYDAYRKHCKDWKKVAAAVRNRSIEMVESLYTMNRAYLSLPEGTASVVGLIAMMTDYYCNLAGSDSEQESNDGAGTSRKPQKRPRGKVHPSSSKASQGNTLLPSQNLASTYGCLSLLKKKRSGGSRPRAVGKRTPRFPVSFPFENASGEKYFSPTRQGLKLKANANDDEVAHEIALALAEASHRGGSPQVSQTRNKKTESIMSSPVRKAERKYSELEIARSKPGASDIDEEELEGSMEADTGELSGYRTYFTESESADKLFRRARRSSGKNLEADDSIENQFDDIKEACSGTEESQRLGGRRGKFDIEVSDTQTSRSSLQGTRKRSKKVLFTKDEESAFDALQTLADLSLRMPGVADEDESMVQVKDEFDDHVDESGSQDAMAASHITDRRKSSSVKAKGNQAISRFETASTKASKIGKVSVVDDSAEHDSKISNQTIIKAVRKKPRASASKIRKTEAHDINRSESLEAEARDMGKKSMSKIKRSSQSASPTLAKNHEHSSSTDPRREGSDSAQSTVQVSVVNEVNLPTKARSRRKMALNKPQTLGGLMPPEKVSGGQINETSSSFHDRALSLKQMLSNCLSNYRARRWCIFEWFYSAIDYPWFAKREFVEYLYHVGLGHVPRLTRVEWGVIRSSLGKPRRFSEQFLKEEKEKLNQYRDSVRAHYTELREGIREGLPTDLARPLSVGQRVISIHPRTREVHDGSVLTVDHSRCRVQFDLPDLGVEFVMDIDCLPCNPLENMPTSLARHAVAFNKFFESFNELKLNGLVKELLKCPPVDAIENVNGLLHLSPTYGMSLLKQTKAPDQVPVADANGQARIGSTENATYKQTTNSQPSTLAQIQAKEADVQALADLTRALDKKEAVVLELRRMNDDVLESQKDGKSSLKDSEPFKKQYAAILVQLDEANQQVASALYCLRQRNTYQGHIPLTWKNANLVDPSSLLSSFDLSASQPQEPGTNVNEIIESSKTKARGMVDAAMQALSTLKVGDNNIQKIEEVIDYVNDWLPLDDSCAVPATEVKPENTSERKDPEIPSQLITQCVATLLMIQKCTERQFPPADVAQILDSAVTGLQPCCSENLPLYAEIQKCMGIIRNQILALIPT